MATDNNIVENVSDFIDMSKILMMSSNNRKELHSNMDVIGNIIHGEETKTETVMTQG